MKPIEVPIPNAITAALATRDLRVVHASMRLRSKDPSATAPAGFDVTLEHITGKGAAVTGSGNTLLEALDRARAAFDRYVRAELEDRLRR